MKFLITSGRKKGFSFTVSDSEFKIGRRKDNDVALDDESISGHHAKIVIEDGKVFAVDCDSINGIEVNGKATKKAPLEKGDVLTVGMTQITAVGEEEDVPAADEKKDEEAAPEKKLEKKSRPPSKKTDLSKNILAVVLVLAVVVVGFLMFKNRKPSAHPTAGGRSSPERSKGAFRLNYEKVKASKEDIFRYEMRIENNTLFVSVDDIKQGRSVHRDKEITTNQVADLRDTIRDQQILALPTQTEGKSLDVWESSTLSVLMDGEAHTVQVVNRVPPENLKSVCSRLESFGENELNINTLFMPLDELKKKAQESCQRAHKLYEERSINPDNLYNSIKAYADTINLLDSVDPKPSIYADAIHGKQVAADELENQIKDHEFRASRAIQLRDWKVARDELSMILQKSPDPTDKHYQDARIRILDVEKRLQTR